MLLFFSYIYILSYKKTDLALGRPQLPNLVGCIDLLLSGSVLDHTTPWTLCVEYGVSYMASDKSQITNNKSGTLERTGRAILPLKRAIRYVCKLFDTPRSVSNFWGLMNGFIWFLCYVISIGASGSNGCMVIFYFWFVISDSACSVPLTLPDVGKREGHFGLQE